ncbi:MAG: alpha/beta fold hydrolase [Alphaproteobacteria bacterium]
MTALIVLLVLLLPIGALWGMSLLAIRKVRKANPPLMDLIDVGDEQVHAYVMGADKPGTPIVLIHGASGNIRDQVTGMMAGLAKDRPVIAFDRPGFGWSSRPKGVWVDPGQQAAQLREALIKLGYEKAIIVGHSYGGSLALAWAVDAPQTVAGVVSLAGAVQPYPTNTATYRKLLGVPLIGGLFAHLIAPWAGPLIADKAMNGTFWPEQPPENYAEDIGIGMLFQPTTFRFDAQDVRNLNGWLTQNAKRWRQINVPVLAIHGNRDPITGYKINSIPLVDQVAQGRFVKLPGAGHLPHHTRKAECVALISDFAADCDAHGLSQSA